MIFKASTKKGDFDSYAFNTTWRYGYKFMQLFLQVIIDIDFKGKVDRLVYSKLADEPVKDITEELAKSNYKVKKCPTLVREQGHLGLAGFSNTLKKNVQFWLFNQTNYFEIDIADGIENVNTLNNYLNSVEILAYKKLAVSDYIAKNIPATLNSKPANSNTKKNESEDDNSDIPDYINLGILGFYPMETFLNSIEEEDEKEALEFLKIFENNLKFVNEVTFSCIYRFLTDTAFPMWEYPEFDKFIDRSKLPENFDESEPYDKYKLFYDYRINEGQNVIEFFASTHPFILVNKLKDDIKVTNVTLDLQPNFKEIHIEFKGICNFLYSMISFEYVDGKFKLSGFSGS